MNGAGLAPSFVNGAGLAPFVVNGAGLAPSDVLASWELCMQELASVGLSVPEILLPGAGVDPSRWAVIACDQYTSQPEYWKEEAKRIGAAPSALHLVLPEVWLGSSDEAARVAEIHEHMRAYLASGVFAPPLRGFVLVDRATAHVASRRGLLVALDLERYRYTAGARALVRATEATVEERLPPRLRVREGAALELPHVLVLIDDPARTVIEPLASAARETLYDFALAHGAGRLRGGAVTGAAELEQVARALGALADAAAKHDSADEPYAEPFLYAVGDGNHSLAAAKLCWERLETSLGSDVRARHPARFALVELVNVHDPGLRFLPIHRIVFRTDPDALLAALPGWFARAGVAASLEPVASDAALRARLTERRAAAPQDHFLGWVDGERRGVLALERPRERLAVTLLQEFLDAHVAAHPESSLDYIHGDDVLVELAARPGRVGLLLPALAKAELFPLVARDGALPRKAFSLGEADEKRFYFEARRIRGDE